MDAPRLAGDMTEDNKTVFESSAPAGSIAARSKQQLLAEARSAKENSADPIARCVMQEEDIAGFQPGVPIGGKISGTVDPMYANKPFQIGDKIYHKTLKVEGEVEDVLATGQVVVTLAGGRKGKTDPSKLAKL